MIKDHLQQYPTTLAEDEILSATLSDLNALSKRELALLVSLILLMFTDETGEEG